MIAIIISSFIVFIACVTIFGEKGIVKDTETYYFDIVFIRRMQSIGKHINWSISKESFELLEVAESRLVWENEMPHDQYELDMIAELSQMIIDARGIIESIKLQQN